MADDTGSESKGRKRKGPDLGTEPLSLSVHSECGENDLDLCIKNCKEVEDDDEGEDEDDDDGYHSDEMNDMALKLIEMYLSPTEDEDDDDGYDSDETSDMAVILLALKLIKMRKNRLAKQPCRRTSKLSTGEGWVKEILYGHSAGMFGSAMMDAQTFMRFCEVLRERNYIADDHITHVSIEEAVALFLVMMSCDGRVCGLAKGLNRSPETINRSTVRVVRAICELGRIIIASRPQQGGHYETVNNRELYPWFKGCIGAIDGKHISALPPAEREEAFRNRHGKLTQNVMFACDHDMRFVYVYAGCEGSAHDAQVFQSALDKGFPVPAHGKYFAVDKLYRNMPGFLAPFRGHRYHERQFKGQGGCPRNAQELFNQRHCLLRNVVERCFGVLKRRFRFLNEPMQNFKMTHQVMFVIACCVLHNFIRENDREDQLFAEVDDVAGEDEIFHSNAAEEDQPLPNVDQPEISVDQWNIWRATLANRMWNAEMAGR